jgi:hypothetical protein
MQDASFSFIVLQTKVINNIIMVYGGLVYHRQDFESCLLHFKWFKLSELHEI